MRFVALFSLIVALAAASATLSAKDAPAVLGDPPHPPPDPSGLPPASARVMRAAGLADFREFLQGQKNKSGMSPKARELEREMEEKAMDAGFEIP